MAMKKRIAKYPPEFRAQLVDLVRRGLTPLELGEEFGVHATTIRAWLRQAEVDVGQREGVPSDAREELLALRRENKQLLEEREILKKYAAWAAQEATWKPPKRSGS